MTAEMIPKYFYAEKCFSADSPVCRAFFCSSEFISHYLLLDRVRYTLSAY